MMFSKLIPLLLLGLSQIPSPPQTATIKTHSAPAALIEIYPMTTGGHGIKHADWLGWAAFEGIPPFQPVLTCAAGSCVIVNVEVGEIFVEFVQ